MNQAQQLSLACLAQVTLYNESLQYDDFDPADLLFEIGLRPSGVVDLWCYCNDPYNGTPACHVGYVYPNGQVQEKVDSEGWPGNYLDVVKTSSFDITYCPELAEMLAV